MTVRMTHENPPAVTVRRPRPEDHAALARVCFDAFGGINRKHGFPPEIPVIDVAEFLMGYVMNHPLCWGVVAEQDGRPVGSAFVQVQHGIGGVGPVTVDPAAQSKAVGRALMDAILDHCREHRVAGVRLLQAGFNMASMSLYTKVGFAIREPLALVNGTPLGRATDGFPVRPATQDDLPACDALCASIHGHPRGPELREAVEHGTARVVERHGRVTAYATDIGFMSHAVAETNDELCALIASASAYTGPGFILPLRNTPALNWCLANGLRLVSPLNLMTTGLYTEPRGAWLPSILY
jgi:GNAT superfamily N-acetyltransferase